MDERDPHRLAEERSIAMHAAVAEALRADPGRVEAARRRVESWRQDGTVHRDYVEAWSQLLRRPLEQLCTFLIDRGERATAMRQVSPFAGVLSARERWRIHRQVAVEKPRPPSTGEHS